MVLLFLFISTTKALFASYHCSLCAQINKEFTCKTNAQLLKHFEDKHRFAKERSNSPTNDNNNRIKKNLQNKKEKLFRLFKNLKTFQREQLQLAFQKMKRKNLRKSDRKKDSLFETCFALLGKGGILIKKHPNAVLLSCLTALYFRDLYRHRRTSLWFYNN